MATPHATPCGAVANARRPPDGVAGRQGERSRHGGVAVWWSHSDPDGAAAGHPMTTPARRYHAPREPACEAGSRWPGVPETARRRRDRSRSRQAAGRRCPGPVPRPPPGGARQLWWADRSALGLRADASQLGRGSGAVPTAPPFGGLVDRSWSDLLLARAVVRDHEATVGKPRASGNRELRQSEVWRTTVSAGGRDRASG
jgi:hypothetical protein